MTLKHSVGGTEPINLPLNTPVYACIQYRQNNLLSMMVLFVFARPSHNRFFLLLVFRRKFDDRPTGRLILLNVSGPMTHLMSVCMLTYVARSTSIICLCYVMRKRKGLN